MPPICLVPFRDNSNFSAFQYQQLSLQRGSQICMELNRISPPRVSVCVQNATKKRVEGRSNCFRVQCSIKLKGGFRVLWPTLQVLPEAEQKWIPFAGLQQLTPRRSCTVNIHSKCATKALGYPHRQSDGYQGWQEIRTMRLDVMVQVSTPTGWRRQTTATQVAYTWCMAHLAWVFGQSKPWLLGKRLQKMLNKPLPARALAAPEEEDDDPEPQPAAVQDPAPQDPAAAAAAQDPAPQPAAQEPAPAAVPVAAGRPPGNNDDDSSGDDDDEFDDPMDETDDYFE